MELDKTLTEQSSMLDVFERDNHSFSYWTKLYYNIHIVGSPTNTVKAKTNDIKKFLVFLDQSIGTHNVNLWTPSVSKSFCNYLLDQNLQPTSINRCAATLRHFATWLHKEKPLPAGHPYTGVKDLVTDEPVWNGLTTQQILLLKSACDIRLTTCTKKNQNPIFDAAIFYVLLNTGLREFELV